MQGDKGVPDSQRASRTRSVSTGYAPAPPPSPAAPAAPLLHKRMPHAGHARGQLRKGQRGSLGEKRQLTSGLLGRVT